MRTSMQKNSSTQPEKSLPDIVGMNMVAEAGYPNVVCPVIFLSGCNLRCPYCLNSSISRRADPRRSSPSRTL
jgi:pyruvate-formate lyase-activating enzyme